MIIDIWSEKYFEELTPEDLRQFNVLVLEDIKGEYQNENLQVLLKNIDLWMFQLRIIRKDIEFQLASQKSKDKIKYLEINNNEEEIREYTIRQNKWRMGAVRFLTAIEYKMLYVKLIMSEATQQNLLDDTV